MHLTLTKKLQKLHRGSRTNKRPDTHSTHLLSGNCQRVGFRDADSHTGRKFRSPLKYLCSAWEDWEVDQVTIRFLIVSSSGRWCYLTWPVGAPSIGLRYDKRSAGSNSFAKEAEKEKRGCRVWEDTHASLAGTGQKRRQLETSNHLWPWLSCANFLLSSVFLHCAGDSTRQRVKLFLAFQSELSKWAY